MSGARQDASKMLYFVSFHEQSLCGASLSKWLHIAALALGYL